MKIEIKSGLLNVVVKTADPHQFWGVQYADGHSTAYGWGPIENASAYEVTQYSSKDPDPTGWTYEGSPYIEELRQGYVAQMRKVTIYDIAE